MHATFARVCKGIMINNCAVNRADTQLHGYVTKMKQLSNKFICTALQSATDSLAYSDQADEIWRLRKR